MARCGCVSSCLRVSCTFAEPGSVQGVWKMVTGLINAGEDIPAGAAREVCPHQPASYHVLQSKVLWPSHQALNPLV